MQYKLLEILRCPINKENLELIVFKTANKKYLEDTIEEVKDGILISSSNWIFPIINGVPRMHLYSFLDYENFLIYHYKQFYEKKEIIFNNYENILKQALKKTRKTQKSFAQEWTIFKYNNDTTWGFTKESRKKRFLEELNISKQQLGGKKLLDVGCGNGILTSGIAEYDIETFGIDVSSSVERAYLHNDKKNAHFLQADLQNPPFESRSFDIVYSTGVLHHTNNTELSFSCISPLVKQNGRLYIWLYKPEKDFRHNFLINLRKITNKLPIRIQYILYLIFLVPQGLLKEKLRGKKITWREQLVNYFDVLSCEFRYEHLPEEVKVWYCKRDFSNLTISINEYLGFGIFGDKL